MSVFRTERSVFCWTAASERGRRVSPLAYVDRRRVDGGGRRASTYWRANEKERERERERDPHRNRLTTQLLLNPRRAVRPQPAGL